LDQEVLARSCLKKKNKKKNNGNGRGSRAGRRMNAMPGTGCRCCNIPSCNPRALHWGPLVTDADVQAEYADTAATPTETEVVEHGLDAGHVRELDLGAWLLVLCGRIWWRRGWFLHAAAGSLNCGANYEEEEANFVLQRRTITKRSQHDIGPYGPISTYFTKFKLCTKWSRFEIISSPDLLEFALVFIIFFLNFFEFLKIWIREQWIRPVFEFGSDRFYQFSVNSVKSTEFVNLGWNAPTSVSDIRSFLGLAGYYRILEDK
jgi:hypothetical protein